GLDIDALDAVFNYHMAHDTEVHIHRIGRTGRAGSKGAAFTFFSHEDGYKMALLEDYLEHEIHSEPLPSASLLGQAPSAPAMITLHIDGGKKDKLRPGDILGALTGQNGIEGAAVGKILVTDYRAYVAVSRSVAKKALGKITGDRIKGKSYRAWLMK
ncbi:MAG: DbpA RNA binding domain-containing protein, partial [Plesiomonas shigelloides]